MAALVDDFGSVASANAKTAPSALELDAFPALGAGKYAVPTVSIFEGSSFGPSLFGSDWKFVRHPDKSAFILDLGPRFDEHLRRRQRPWQRRLLQEGRQIWRAWQTQAAHAQ